MNFSMHRNQLISIEAFLIRPCIYVDKKKAKTKICIRCSFDCGSSITLVVEHGLSEPEKR